MRICLCICVKMFERKKNEFFGRFVCGSWLFDRHSLCTRYELFMTILKTHFNSFRKTTDRSKRKNNALLMMSWWDSWHAFFFISISFRLSIHYKWTLRASAGFVWIPHEKFIALFVFFFRVFFFLFSVDIVAQPIPLRCL